MTKELPPQPWTWHRADNEEIRDAEGTVIADVYNDGLANAIQALPALLAALETARHALTTLHGLTVADGAAPVETWTINESRVLAEIDAALLAVRP